MDAANNISQDLSLSYEISSADYAAITEHVVEEEVDFEFVSGDLEIVADAVILVNPGTMVDDVRGEWGQLDEVGGLDGCWTVAVQSMTVRVFDRSPRMDMGELEVQATQEELEKAVAYVMGPKCESFAVDCGFRYHGY